MLLRKTRKEAWLEEIKPSEQSRISTRCDELSQMNDIVFMGEKILISSHTVYTDPIPDTRHMNIETRQQRACDAVCWPGMSKQIEEIV